MSDAANTDPMNGVAGAIAREQTYQTQFLRQLVEHARERDEAEDRVTVSISTTAGDVAAYVFAPAVQPVGNIDIEAWQSGDAIPMVVLDGRYPDAAATVADGYVNALLSVPTAGCGRARVPAFSGTLTIVPLGTPTSGCLVTVRVRACEPR